MHHWHHNGCHGNFGSVLLYAILLSFFTLNLEDIYRNANTKVPSKDLVNIANNTSLHTAGFMIFYSSQAKSMKWNLAHSGFTGCKTAITKWSKQTEGTFGYAVQK